VFTLKVSPRETAEIKRIVTVEPLEFKVTALPDWRVRPAVGLTFLVAPNAEYETFGSAKDGDVTKVVRKGTVDHRFTYGLTLGLSYQRGEQPRVRLWLPELTVNPLDDVKAMGVGAAGSYGVLKLGVGILWMRHTVLDGQNVDDVIPSADALSTRDAYGKGRFYAGLSLIGLPPFVRGK
jgi:hypothetical protein